MRVCPHDRCIWFLPCSYDFKVISKDTQISPSAQQRSKEENLRACVSHPRDRSVGPSPSSLGFGASCWEWKLLTTELRVSLGFVKGGQTDEQVVNSWEDKKLIPCTFHLVSQCPYRITLITLVNLSSRWLQQPALSSVLAPLSTFSTQAHFQEWFLRKTYVRS